MRVVEQDMTPWATAFHRFWLTAVIVGAWNGITLLRERLVPTATSQEESHQSWDLWIWLGLVAAGLFLAIDLVLWAWSLTQTSVGNATLLANLTPLFTTLGAWFWFGKQFDRKFLAGLVIAIGGMIAIGLEDWIGTADKFPGDVAALAAALAFGVYLLLLEKLQTRLKPSQIVFWSSAAASILTLPLVLLVNGNPLPTSWQDWLAIGALVLICQIVGQGLLVYSLNYFSSALVALCLLLDPVLAALGANFFFAEKLDVSNWLAFAVVLIGMYFALSSQSEPMVAAND
jgi:drug/metabolite transporter (DMT)-like permease